MAKQFSINASQELIDYGNDLLEKVSQKGDTKGDALRRVFDIVNSQLTGSELKDSGVNADALDASLKNIRTMFIDLVMQKDEILKSKDEDLQKIKDAKDKMEIELREKIKSITVGKDQALKDAAEAANLKKQISTFDELIKSKDDNIVALNEKLLVAEEKAKSYDDLLEQKKLSDNKIRDLEIALRESNIEKKHAISDVQKDDELKKQQAVSDAVRAADRENAKLSARIDLLEEQIANLRAQLQQYSV